jgi:hypothetical protein
MQVKNFYENEMELYQRIAKKIGYCEAENRRMNVSANAIRWK